MAEEVKTEVNHEDTVLERLLSFLFEALPSVLVPLKTEIDETKIIKNPPKFIKEHSASAFRKKHKGDSFWAQQDIVDKWTQKYLPEVKEGEVKVAVTDGKVLITYPDSLNAAMGEYELNPVAAAERFVAEAVEVAVSPVDAPMNPDKVVKEPPRWAKPVNLSKLRKTLSKDPDYFKK